MFESPLLVIGLDGATWAVLDDLIAAHDLPHLGRICQNGASFYLHSVPNQNSAPAWTSFATGVNPGKHGIYYFTEPVFGSLQRRYLKGGDRAAPAFWQIASAAGRRMAIVNVPMSYPCEPVNGVMISGLDAPTDHSPGVCHPPDLLNRLRSVHGEYLIEPGIPSLLKRGLVDQVIPALLHSIDVRLRYALALLKEDRWDLFVVVFTDSDAAQHVFWNGEAQHYADLPERSQRALRTIYTHLDQAVGALTGTCPDASVMILSDHGGGFNQRGAEYLQSWLSNAGYLRFLPTSPATRLWRAGYHLLDRSLSRRAKQAIASRLPRLRARAESASSFGHIDWRGTLAYADNLIDEIWVNAMGREPYGSVPPDQVETLITEIIDELLQAVDLRSNRPIVEYAWRREQIYAGPPDLLSKAADITIRWRTDGIISGIRSPKGMSDPSLFRRPPLVSGGHRPEGILILSGPLFQSQSRRQTARLIDIAPTILHVIGLPVPGYMDGQVLRSATYPDRPVRIDHNQSIGGGHGSRSDYDSQEQSLIEERLRALGYIQ